jgi:hypothetical protein
MTELEAPVKDALRKTTTVASVTRMWSRIEARGRAPSRAPSPRRAWFLVAALAVATSVAFGGVTKVWRPERPASEGAPQASPVARARESTGEGRRAAPGPSASPSLAATPLETSPADTTSTRVSSAPFAQPLLPSRPSAASSARPSAETWRQLAARGENAEAYAQLGRAGLASASKSASVSDLFALADVARLSDHAAEAREPLERIIASYPTDARASLAALTLGRIELRSLGAPAAAAGWLERGLALGLPADLDREAYALLVESRATAGDRAGAKAAYAQYRARFPGSAAEELRKWVSEP